MSRNSSTDLGALVSELCSEPFAVKNRLLPRHVRGIWESVGKFIFKHIVAQKVGPSNHILQANVVHGLLCNISYGVLTILGMYRRRVSSCLESAPSLLAHCFKTSMQHSSAGDLCSTSLRASFQLYLRSAPSTGWQVPIEQQHLLQSETIFDST